MYIVYYTKARFHKEINYKKVCAGRVKIIIARVTVRLRSKRNKFNKAVTYEIYDFKSHKYNDEQNMIKVFQYLSLKLYFLMMIILLLIMLLNVIV